jgi:hypothetical protein
MADCKVKRLKQIIRIRSHAEGKPIVAGGWKCDFCNTDGSEVLSLDAIIVETFPKFKSTHKAAVWACKPCIHDCWKSLHHENSKKGEVSFHLNYDASPRR